MARVSIEDCLKTIENRFALVTIASDRARKLMDGDVARIKTKNKHAVTALREIAEGLIIGVNTYQKPEDIPEVVKVESVTPVAAQEVPVEATNDSTEKTDA